MSDETKRKHIDQDAALPPNPETLNTPDPQENMEGPVSSTMHSIGDGFDTAESKEEADREKDENM